MTLQPSFITLQIGNPGRDTSLGNGGIFNSGQGTSKEIEIFESYVFHQNFMHPTSSFTFTVGDLNINDEFKDILVGGATISLQLHTPDHKQRPIATGIIDQINKRISEHGSFLEIRGRDFISQAADDGIDPISSQFEFAEGQTLGQLLAAVFNQYGINTFYNSDVFARDIVTGVNYSKAHATTQTIKIPSVTNLLEPDGTAKIEYQEEDITVWVDPTAPPIEQLTIKRCKPEWGETSYSFAETHCKRFHLHLWGMPDASGVVVGSPDYTTAPQYTFTNKRSGVGNNLMSSKLDIDYCNMPNLIIGRMKQGGGDTAYLGSYTFCVNEFTAFTVSPDDSTQRVFLDAIDVVLNRFKNSNGGAGIEQVIRSGSDALLAFGEKYFNQPNVARVVWWDDKTSKTIAELEASMARRMSEFQRNALRYTIVVQGHAQGNLPYRFNSMATVTDEDWGINGEVWWVESVTYSQSVGSGTTTEIVLIPPFVLNF